MRVKICWGQKMVEHSGCLITQASQISLVATFYLCVCLALNS